MRKFVSILLAVCLLGAMALPAAAEEAPVLPELCAENGGIYVTELSVPKDVTREVSFYTRNGETVTPAAAPAVEDDSVAGLSKEEDRFVLTGKSVGTTKLTLWDADGNAASTAMTVNVPASTLEIRKKGGEWGTSLSGIEVNEEVEVELRLGADGVYDNCIGMSTASEGLMRQTDVIWAEAAGTYTLSYKGYSVSVTVDPEPVTNEIPISIGDLSKLDNQTAFDEFLRTNHYSGSGDLTLLLPAEDMGNITCSVQLPGDAGLILRGASGSTTMSGLTVHSTNFSVDGIKCTGTSGMTLKVMEGDQTKWNVTVPSGTTRIDGKILKETVTPLEKAVRIEFDSGIISLSSGGWSFSYSYHGGTDTVYVVNEGILTSRARTFNVTKPGAYFVVEGTPPTVVTKDASTKTVTISKEQSQYLQKVSLSTGFKSVQVTDSKGNKIYATCNSDGVVTFYVKYDTADTYTIQQVSATTTVTKTTTTSRRYTASTSTQDCYLVTPAGFSNAVRAVQDGLVTLDCTQAGRKSISLPVESLAAAAQAGYSVLVKTPNAELTLDAAALKSLAQQARGTTVLLSYQSLNHKTLTAIGQASVQSHLARNPNDCADLAFLVTAASDSETIEDLQQGTVTLKIPFIVLPGTEDQENVVYALQGETVTDARETTVADGYLTTKLLDLTEHMVFQIGEPVETTEATEETTTTQPETEPVPETTQPPEPEETVKSFPVWILVIVVLLPAGGAAAWFLYLRKRFKK